MTLARPAQTFFLGIGAEKAGTSWMHRHLARHPAVWTPPHKEIHYFDTVHLESGTFYRESKYRTLRKQLQENEWSDLAARPARLARLRWFAKQALIDVPTDDWYRSLFEEVGDGYQAFGEVTPAYAALPREGFEHIRAVEPEARIILLLRDPVYRLWSAIRYYSNNRPERSVMGSTNDMVAFARRPLNVAKTRYDHSIDHLQSLFAPDQVLIAFYEDIFSDTTTQIDFLRRLGEFLGVDPDGLIASHTPSSINASPPSTLPAELDQVLGAEYAGVVDRVEAQLGRVPESWRRHQGFSGATESAS